MVHFWINQFTNITIARVKNLERNQENNQRTDTEIKAKQIRVAMSKLAIEKSTWLLLQYWKMNSLIAQKVFSIFGAPILFLLIVLTI